MDRSYPYSRRQLSRARLRKRAAAVSVAVLAGAAGLFMLAWKPDPISAAVSPHAAALPALPDAGAAGSPGIRRIYPYSVVPGGVSGRAELARVIRTDRVVAAHYASFDVDKAQAVVVDKPRAVHVSYRKGDKVYWTARKVLLAPGETLLSDGRNEMRARCANRISEVPQYPVEAHQPAMDELDQAMEVDAGDEHGADGLPVSMPGQPALVLGTGGGIAAAAVIPAADRTLTSSLSSGLDGSLPGTGLPYVWSSGTAGSWPPPADPTTPAPGADSSNGASGSPPPAGGNAEASPPADTLAGTPVPGTEAPPVTTPGGQQSGSESIGELPPAPPGGNGPLFPQPEPVAEPFIPKPELTEPPTTGGERPAPPASVPEPGGICLFGTALAGLFALRRIPGARTGPGRPRH